MFVVIVTDPRRQAPSKRHWAPEQRSTPVAYHQMKNSLSVSILKEDKLVEAYPIKANTIEIVNSLDTFSK